MAAADRPQPLDYRMQPVYGTSERLGLRECAVHDVVTQQSRPFVNMKNQTLVKLMARPSPPKGQGATVRMAANLSEFAYRTVYDLILSRKLVGGEVIIEGRLAVALNISRTPLREALGRLEGEGLLVKQASRSFMVRKVSASEFFQSMKTREILEGEAIQLALGKVDPVALAGLRVEVVRLSNIPAQGKEHWQADDRLHQLFAEASGNSVIAKMIRDLRITTRLFEVSRPFDRVQVDGEEHLAIVDAYQSGDPRRARKAIQRHLRNLQTDVLEILSGVQ